MDALRRGWFGPYAKIDKMEKATQHEPGLDQNREPNKYSQMKKASAGLEIRSNLRRPGMLAAWNGYQSDNTAPYTPRMVENGEHQAFFSLSAVYVAERGQKC